MTMICYIGLKMTRNTWGAGGLLSYMVGIFADLGFGLILEVWPLGPVEGDGSSGLWRRERKVRQTNQVQINPNYINEVAV